MEKTTKFKIREGIKLPKKESYRKYPFSDMEIGDSFIVGKYSRYLMTNCLNAARNWAKQSDRNWEFAARKIEYEKSGTYTIGIWRVS